MLSSPGPSVWAIGVKFALLLSLASSGATASPSFAPIYGRGRPRAPEPAMAVHRARHRLYLRLGTISCCSGSSIKSAEDVR